MSPIWHAHRLTRQDWTHGAHVGVCAYYAFDHDEAVTLAIMRPGIRSFNESIGGQNTATNGYHESISRLWVMAISAVDVVNDQRARGQWVPPDLPLPWECAPARGLKPEA